MLAGTIGKNEFVGQNQNCSGFHLGRATLEFSHYVLSTVLKLCHTVHGNYGVLNMREKGAEQLLSEVLPFLLRTMQTILRFCHYSTGKSNINL